MTRRKRFYCANCGDWILSYELDADGFPTALKWHRKSRDDDMELVPEDGATVMAFDGKSRFLSYNVNDSYVDAPGEHTLRPVAINGVRLVPGLVRCAKCDYRNEWR